EQVIPGAVEQAVQDVDTFIQELAAFQEWQIGAREAAAISQPVLSVMGVAGRNPYMQEVRALLHSWFPQTEDCDVPTTHLLQMQDPKGVADALAEFFSRHPMA
ncbi:MAG TPA: alpha/beta hydrolase, partial [Anaerolineae bacterium]